MHSLEVVMSENNKITIREVAVEANVGISTVSRVINHLSKVASSTRKRVLSVIRDMEYTPNEAAKRLARSRAKKEPIEPKDIGR